MEDIRNQVKALSGTVAKDSDKIQNIEYMVNGLVNNFGVYVKELAEKK